MALQNVNWTGNIRELQNVMEHAVVVLEPGAGFDVVPTDCLALYLKQRLPSATHLTLAFRTEGPGGLPPGTQRTTSTAPQARASASAATSCAASVSSTGFGRLVMHAMVICVYGDLRCVPLYLLYQSGGRTRMTPVALRSEAAGSRVPRRL